MELILVRHGQTAYNAEFRFQGRIDIPLNETGQLQGARVKHILESKRIQFEVIFSSPLKRAVDTAHIIAHENSKVFVDGRLIEIDLGEFDGRLEKSIANELGTAKYKEWREQNFLVPAPSGESLQDVMQRVQGFLAQLSQSKHQGNVVIVAHQGVLMALKACISEDVDHNSLKQFKQANNEIDIWNLNSGARIKTIRFEVDRN